ncbi:MULTISPECIES: helix-turn-helix domain-containing protein [unclassified Paenibacillus]|uniref:helix-turn-helix domain-containing protein n=1 Tax=unclassified Paenibacillus TaxID=185978 RepID=UPI0009309E55|nr:MULTISPECIES: helix-turn-helix domain-containing protein [unclassified Paenibacillus]
MKKAPILLGSCPTIPIRRIGSYSNLLEKPNKPNLSFRKQALFKDLLKGTITAKHSKWEMLQLGRMQESVPTNLAIVEIDGYPLWFRSYTSDDCGLLKLEAQRAILEIADMYRVLVWAEWIEPHRLGILTQTLEANQPISMIHLCDRLRERIATQLKTTVTVGIGVTAKDWSDMAASYKIACSALDFKAALGSNRLIVTEDISSRQECDMIRQLQLMHMIGQAYRMGNVVWVERYRVLFEELRHHLFTRDELLNMFTYFIYHLHLEMSELLEKYREIWKRDTLPLLQEILQEKDTLVQIEVCFYDTLMHCFERMKTIRDGTCNRVLIQNLKGFIEERFNDQNFSLTYVSDHFGLNSSYLSRLFKEEFGETFISYVTRVRIETAKMLLLKTPGSIKEVSKHVGYLNPLTFTRIFKKNTGKTPSVYRQQDI